MEHCIPRKLLYEKRNELLREGRYTYAIDELILKIIDARGANMNEIAKRLNAIYPPPLIPVIATDQLYQAYAESHESDPREISDGLEEFLCNLPLDNNNAIRPHPLIHLDNFHFA